MTLPFDLNLDGLTVGLTVEPTPEPGTPVVQAALDITAYGIAAPQGSKSGFVHPHTKRVILKESSNKVKPWREDVRHAALAAMEQAGLSTITGPVSVRMVFTMPKPASAPKTKRTWAMRYPDLSKLARSTEDALTSAGVWEDDARVVEYERLAKVFPNEDREALDRPGVRISIRRVIA